MRTKTYFILLLITVFLTGCGEYQKLLKSRDPEEKYQAALRYFNEKQYVKSQTLLDDVSSYYRGSERSEDVLAYLARSYMGQKSYESATSYYQAYIRNYPKGKYAAEAYFQIGHCQYLDSPDARLDQAVTRNAIDAFTQFVELYPESPYAEQAYQEMSEMYDKLALKELKSAQLYYNLGTYLGNNYLSCEITAKNALKNYPSNKYQEDFSWLILQAKYQQLVNSFEERKIERARDAQDEYYNFITEYPNSKRRKEAEKMMQQIRKYTQQ
jgi:outer membrane protein assembly factor BamD